MTKRFERIDLGRDAGRHFSRAVRAGRTRLCRVQLAVFVLLSALSEGCVSARIEFEDVQVTKQNLAFPGVTELARALARDGYETDPVMLAAAEAGVEGSLAESLDAEESPEARLAAAEARLAAAESLTSTDEDAADPLDTSAEPAVDAEVDAEIAAEFSAAAAALGQGILALPPQKFSYSGAAASLPDAVATAFELHDITVQSRSNEQDLGFVQRLLLTVSAPEIDAGRPMVVFDHVRDSTGRGKAGSVLIPIQGKARTLNREQLARATYELAVWADVTELPSTTWSVDVSLRLSGQVSVEM